MPITETAEQIAFRFLKDYHQDDQGLVEGWRRNSDRRWNLTVQLCHSFLEEIRAAPEQRVKA